MVRAIKDLWPILLMILGFTFLAIFASLAKWHETYSTEAVLEADFLVNNGKEVYATDYEVIIDQETGMEYLYFPGRGVTPYLDKNGEPLKVVE